MTGCTESFPTTCTGERRSSIGQIVEQSTVCLYLDWVGQPFDYQVFHNVSTCPQDHREGGFVFCKMCPGKSRHHVRIIWLFSGCAGLPDFAVPTDTLSDRGCAVSSSVCGTEIDTHKSRRSRQCANFRQRTRLSARDQLLTFIRSPSSALDAMATSSCQRSMPFALSKGSSTGLRAGHSLQLTRTDTVAAATRRCRRGDNHSLFSLKLPIPTRLTQTVAWPNRVVPFSRTQGHCGSAMHPAVPKLLPAPQLQPGSMLSQGGNSPQV